MIPNPYWDENMEEVRFDREYTFSRTIAAYLDQKCWKVGTEVTVGTGSYGFGRADIVGIKSSITLIIESKLSVAGVGDAIKQLLLYQQAIPRALLCFACPNPSQLSEHQIRMLKNCGIFLFPILLVYKHFEVEVLDIENGSGRILERRLMFQPPPYQKFRL